MSSQRWPRIGWESVLRLPLAWPADQLTPTSQFTPGTSRKKPRGKRHWAVMCQLRISTASLGCRALAAAATCLRHFLRCMLSSIQLCQAFTTMHSGPTLAPSNGQTGQAEPGNSASHTLRPEPGRQIVALGLWNCDPQGD